MKIPSLRLALRILECPMHEYVSIRTREVDRIVAA
jgi:hypothetical protein